MSGRLAVHFLFLVCLATEATRGDDAPLALPALPSLPEESSSSPFDLDRTARDEAPPPVNGRKIRLEELERIALSQNPTIAQAIDRFEQARGRALQAGVYPNPLIIWSASSLGDERTAGLQTGMFQQPIIMGGKLRVNRAVYEVDVEMSRWSVYIQQQQTRNGVRMRYLHILAQQKMIEQRADLTRLAEDIVQLTREKIESGHAEEADLLIAESEAEQRQLDLDLLIERHQNSWREFAAYLGCPDLPLMPLEGHLEEETQDLTWETVLNRLLRESPEMRIAQLRVRRQELKLDRERREPIPDLVVRGGAGHDPASVQTLGYAQVYLDVPLWDRNRGNIHTAQRGLLEVRRDLVRVRLNLQQRLARDYNHYQTSLTNIRRYRDELLPRARRALDLYAESFQEEDAGYSRVQAAFAMYSDYNIKYLNEILELRRAEVAIEGLELVEETVGVGTLRPTGSGRLEPPGEGVGSTPAGGGIPVGRPTTFEGP